MMGRILQLYIFMYVLRMTAYFFVGLGLLILLIDFAELNSRFAETPSFTAPTGAFLAVVRLPFIIQVALPFLILAATMTSLMQLNFKNELVIARSAGVSAWQFLAPTWLAAAVIGLVAVVALNPLATKGYSLANETMGQLRGTAPSDSSLLSTQPWLRQSSEDGGSYLIGAQRVSSNGVVLLDAVFIHIGEDGQIIERLDAGRARLVDGFWVLEQITLSKAGNPAIPLDNMEIATSLNPSVITEALIPPEMVSFFALPRQIDTARTFGVPSYPFRMQYHTLMSLPAFMIAMSLIAATVSLRFVRFGQSAGMILGGIIAAFMLYVVSEVAKSFGAAGIISPVFAAWFPVTAAGMFGIAFLLHREDG